jgi:tetratricopeptide (TPR) repeat protein
MAMTRERAPLGQAVLLALVAQALYSFITQAFYSGGLRVNFHPSVVISAFLNGGLSLLFTMLAFVPSVLVVGNLFERRGTTLVGVRQEYAPLAACILYAQAVAHLLAIPLAVLLHASAVDAAYVAKSLESAPMLARMFPAEMYAELLNPRKYAEGFYSSIVLPIYAFWVVVAVREVFRVSWLRSVTVAILGAILMLPVALCLAVLVGLLGPIISSPLILLLLYFFLRGYFGNIAQTQRARLSFRQNLEAATLNPADSSAHYNLGLLHMQRKEPDQARERFERAIKIDPEEVDAHFQLGRIARMQNRLSEAIAHFSEVVQRDEHHAQNEIWREIGETYIAAGQYEDARDALDKFLERRQLDPQGLYLLGRAQAGIGHWRDAAATMQACIEAVKTAPAYKYRTEKRWLDAAENFLREGVRSH